MDAKKKVNNERYEIVCKIGQGAYGKVYLAKDLRTGDTVALKKISMENEEEGIPMTALREISLLKELNHKNIVKLLDVIHSKRKLTMVFEYCDTDLKKATEANDNKGFNESVYKNYLYQILKGVECIHKLKILHRDLKPDNLLLSKDGIVKLADFGLARGYGLPMGNYTNEVVTLWYRPPDVLLGYKNYTTSVDVWSIGCIFGELVNGKPMFQGLSEVDQVKKIFKVIGTPNEKDYPFLKTLSEWKPENFETYELHDLSTFVPTLSSVGLDLLKKMLQFDPEKRPSAAEALSHPFFNDVDTTLKKSYS